MALGSLSYAEARNSAASLGDSADKMIELFNKLKDEMNSLESVLKSKGADELFETYKLLESKMGGFPIKIKEFKGFLEAVVEQYESDDAALSSEVN